LSSALEGTDPADEVVQRLVRKSQELIAEFTGGDPGIHASLCRMYAVEPQARQQWGPPAEVQECSGVGPLAVQPTPEPEAPGASPLTLAVPFKPSPSPVHRTSRCANNSYTNF
jgi:hypothetical protein